MIYYYLEYRYYKNRKIIKLFYLKKNEITCVNA